MVKRKKSYIKKINQLDTLSVHAGVKTDPLTGAVMTPIYATSTYAHDRPGEHKGYEYSRSQNPTREVLENSIAELESGYKAFAFASGVAAQTAVLDLLKPGDHVIAFDDLYACCVSLSGWWQIGYRMVLHHQYHSLGHPVGHHWFSL